MSHPFVLLVAGAIISSLVFPYFTRVWQDAQKELELQSDLADLINRAISSMVVATDTSLSPYYHKEEGPTLPARQDRGRYTGYQHD